MGLTLNEIIDTNYPRYRNDGVYAGGKDGCGYFPIYEKHLPKTVEDFMEIGVAMGISIWMFRDYYEGKGNFHAMNYQFDRDTNKGVIPMKDLQRTGIICHDGRHEDLDFLSTIKTQFDVIVEDGSHRSDHQAIAFKHLFNNNIKEGGLYIIEDLHCCQGEYWWGECQGFDNTMLNMIRNFPNVINLELLSHEPIKNTQQQFKANQFFTLDEYLHLVNTIDKIYLYDPSIALIYKKHGDKTQNTITTTR
jgi:hypothetical protein